MNRKTTWREQKADCKNAVDVRMTCILPRDKLENPKCRPDWPINATYSYLGASRRDEVEWWSWINLVHMARSKMGNHGFGPPTYICHSEYHWNHKNDAKSPTPVFQLRVNVVKVSIPTNCLKNQFWTQCSTIIGRLCWREGSQLCVSFKTDINRRA